MITKKVLSVREFLFFAVVIIILSIWLGIMIDRALKDSEVYPATGKVLSVGEYGETHGLRDFASTDELRDWLAQDLTNELVVVSLDTRAEAEDKCEIYALQLQNHALSDGFKMSFAIMSRVDYYQKFRKWLAPGTQHALNLVIIGNNVYLVEPQSDEFWQVAVLD